MKRERNNLAAGAFVLAGLALAIFLIVLLGDWGRMFTPMQTVSVRYSLADGLRGLQPGSPVDIGGTPRGSVVTIRDEIADDGLLTGYVVHFTIPQRYRIHRNARIELQEPLIGAGTRLNIRSFGMPPDSPLDPAAETADGHDSAYEHRVTPPIEGAVAGTEAVTTAMRELGVDDLQRRQLQNIIANLDNLVATLGEDPAPLAEVIDNVRLATGALADDLPEIGRNIRGGTDDLATVLADLRRRYPAWLEDIDGFLATAVVTVEGAEQALATMNAMLDENRQPLADTLDGAAAAMANAEQITLRVREQTLEQISVMLDEAGVAVANIREVTDDVQGFISGQRPVLERTIANARIVSDQLKLTAIEVRRSPWRLLYQPTDRELNTDNVYDAARSFAMAASTLNATADSLQAIVERHGEVRGDDANVRLILENLNRVFDQFGDAENKFWEALDDVPRR